MKLYLMRHGKDVEGLRGGWSDSNLTKEGIDGVKLTAKKLLKESFDLILSSDLIRAKTTAEIVSSLCEKNIEYDVRLREINNGLLAGMKNSDAEVLFPGLYYNTLKYDENYPNGESPKAFFERIKLFYNEIRKINRNVLIITHAGVINAFYCLIKNKSFTNKKSEISLKYAEYIVLEI